MAQNTVRLIALMHQKWFNTIMSSMHEYDAVPEYHALQLEWGYLKFQAGTGLSERIGSLMENDVRQEMGQRGLFLTSQQAVQLERTGPQRYAPGNIPTIQALQQAERVSDAQPKLAKHFEHESIKEQGNRQPIEIFRMAAMPGIRSVESLVGGSRESAKFIDGVSIRIRLVLARSAFKSGALDSSEFNDLVKDIYGGEGIQLSNLAKPADNPQLYVMRPQFVTRPVQR